MSSVRSQEQATRPSPELVALLKQQSQLRALEKKLASIERAIEEQNPKSDQARAAVPSLQPIYARIGDLLASEAAGHITVKEREEREAALNKEAAKVRAAAAEASALVSRVHATIDGLNTQLRNVKTEIARAKGKCHEALDALLMTEAERLGQEYLELARDVYDRFLQLLAIDRLHHQATGDPGKFTGQMTTLDYGRFYLPAFRVGGHDDHAVGKSKNSLFKEAGDLYLEKPMTEATQRERARLEALGVAFGWNGGRFCKGADTDEQAEEERSAQAA